ncbi:MAG: glutathione S-transferase family protein [Cyanobacteria bacterium]|nr:glutathione S-transferase family protein [Cyanobacteriota bacterium]
MATLELYSAAVCPFAQRSRIVLTAKGLAFTVHEIDLHNKPADFEAISPLGKVPVLCHGGDRVWESTIINEYLEDLFPTPPLLPLVPGQRAIARIWIDFINTRFVPGFYKLLLAQNSALQADWRSELTRHLHYMEHQGLASLSAAGPYWLGDEFSLVDIALYPWFERWAVLSHYRDLPFPADCPRLRDWWARVEAHPAVQATAQTATFHIQQYSRYADGSAAGRTAQEMRRY